MPGGERRSGPWIVVGILAVVAISALVYAASGPSTANAGANGVVAPDISSLTPKEQFDRLIGRVTAAAERGDTATLASLWPMASGAYQNLPVADRNTDTRFHMGWLHLLAGQYPQAAALADTIMSAAPNHLLGYYLRAGVAQAQGDSTRARSAGVAFRAHYDAEIAKTDRPEYAQHREMLDRFHAGGATAP